MNLTSVATSPASATPFHGVQLATLHYTIRQVDGTAKAGDVQVREFFGIAHQAAGGNDFASAVRTAQQAASILQKDGIHPIPVNQAQAVAQAADGSMWIIPLGGPHRDVTGPAFIDGALYDSAGLAVWAAKADDRLLAIVGAKQMFDLRTQATAGRRLISDILS